MIKKVIYIKKAKDVNKFYKLLPIYNSLLFKFIYFDINFSYKIDNGEQILKILNTKNRKKKLETIIDESCKLIDHHFEYKNICGFKNNKCYVQQRKNTKQCNGCCRKCIYQSTTGCQTKNVACKLFFCSEVRKRYEVLTFDDINLLKCLSIRQRLIIKSDYFSKKEDVVKDLYLNSLLIGAFRMIIRILFNNLQLIDK